ncbi:MAG: GNAT family N-acetyltransferase [Candidatus Kryptoniota bacterium]
MIEIRRCDKAYFDDVAKLLGQLWPGKPIDVPSLRIVFERALYSHSQKYICAVEDGYVMGFGSLTIKNNLWQEGYTCHVDEFVVDNKYRHHGVGTRLLQHLVVIAKEKGCRRIELDSAFQRKVAHKFYEKSGFENRAFLFSKIL